MVAENYHNIWAKKKKTELISKGALQNAALVLLDQPTGSAGPADWVALQGCDLCCEFHCCSQEEGPTRCWFPMTP